jgi:pyruvate dehydrogenase E1 component alpha subunit
MRPPDDRDLRMLLLIRRFEEALLRLFGEGAIGGTTHTCLGQEYIPVALTPLLREPDYIFSNHRGHGHYLARFDDPVSLLAEIMGRAGGPCHGVGGSQHLHRDTFFSTGVQGESLPVAVGCALHLKRAGAGGLALAYIGDGTFGQGAVYEALNMARLWSAPLVVVAENNHIAQTTPADRNMGGTIAGRAAAFGLDYQHVASTDVAAARERLAAPLQRVRDGHGPLVAEFDTVRLGPHSKGDDTRGPEELRRLRERDWHAACERSFPGQLAAADAVATARIDAAVAEVKARPLAAGAAAVSGVPR